MVILPRSFTHRKTENSYPDIIRNYLRRDASAYPVCDIDQDGKITIKDARKVVKLYTRSRCARL